MKKNLMILLALSSAMAYAADVSGAWRLRGDVAGVHIMSVCTIQQADNKLTGSCKNETDDLTLTGVVNGNDVTWSYDGNSGGTKVTFVFTGTFGSDSIKGRVAATGASGAFNAKKQP